MHDLREERPPAQNCTALGGYLDPNKEKHWNEYKERKAANVPAKGKGTSKGKHKGKNKSEQPKGGKGDQPAASLIITAKAGNRSTRASRPERPDWIHGANVYLRYGAEEDEPWTESFLLADGSSIACRAHTGPKGIPEAYLQRVKAREQTDLLPFEWLADRWCEVTWSDLGWRSSHKRAVC